MLTSFLTLETAIREAWDEHTCDPVDLPWSRSNPARGQCGVTAMVINDILGGDLMVAEVHFMSGERQGAHTWNRLAGGLEIDLTREQFSAGEIVGPCKVVARPAGLEPGRCLDQYHLLRTRVLTRLD